MALCARLEFRREGPFMKILSIITFGVLFTLSSAPGMAAEEGIINALSLRALPSEKSIQTQPLDNSSDNLALQKVIETELRKGGYTISEQASLILSFSTSDQIGTWDSGSSSHVFSLETKTGRGHEERTKARVNVFDSATGGLLNKGQEKRKPSSIASQYRLDISIEERTTGKTYWRAWSVADLDTGEGIALTTQMIPPLIEGIGRTIRRQAFYLR